jgi:hypothetical protein
MDSGNSTRISRSVMYVALLVIVLIGACESTGQGQVIRDNSSASNSGSGATATSAPPNSLSRISITLLGEIVETGFEAVFVEMYDARDRPAFYEGTMKIEFKDKLDDVLYSKLLTVTQSAKWGPTLDGSEGALLKIPVADFTPGFPGEIFVNVTFNGENGNARAEHTEDSFSLTAIPQLEGSDLDEKISSIWQESKTAIDSDSLEIDGGFFGDSFDLKMDSYGCSYVSTGFGVTETEMLRVDVEVSALGSGVSDIYLPSSFLDTGANAMIEHDGFYGDNQLSVRGGSSATGSYIFEVDNCSEIDSALFLVQNSEGLVLIERDLFNPSGSVVSNPTEQVVSSPTPTVAVSASTVEPTASPVPTSPPAAVGSSLSRITVEPFGELIETGFEALLITMYDGDDAPTFETIRVTIKYTDQLGKVMYDSGLVDLDRDSRWGPTLDGSDGAMVKIPLADFSPGFPGSISIIVTAEVSDGSVLGDEYESGEEGFFSLTSAPTYEGSELSKVIEDQWVLDRAPIEDINTGEFTSIDGLFSGDPYEIIPVWVGCAWAEGIFGGTPTQKTRVDLQVRTAIEGVHEIYLPSAYIDNGGAQLLEPDLFDSTTNLAIRAGGLAIVTYYFGDAGCLTGELIFIQENHSGDIVIEKALEAK